MIYKSHARAFSPSLGESSRFGWGCGSIPQLSFHGCKALSISTNVNWGCVWLLSATSGILFVRRRGRTDSDTFVIACTVVYLCMYYMCRGKCLEIFFNVVQYVLHVCIYYICMYVVPFRSLFLMLR